MGGTTAKICLIRNQVPKTSRVFEVARSYRFKKGSGMPISIPVIDMVEIGAGGGSLAYADAMNQIRVGPESAGSEPGPACYGRGGDRPAVTDADLVLGRLDPDRFAGGTIPLFANRSHSTLAEILGDRLGMNTTEAAWGLAEVVDENMAAAARAHAAEFGMDLGSRDMVAFGGAAPLHAVRLGDKLGVRRIVVPAEAGVGSAVGFLLAPVAYEVVRSRRQHLSELDHVLVNRLMDEMRAESLAVVRMGSASDDLRESRHAYMRYVGQGHEIVVELPVEDYGPDHADAFQKAFEDAYRRLYGRIIEGIDIEVLSWTLTVFEPADKGSEPVNHPVTGGHGVETGRQALFDPGLEATVEAKVYLRTDLQPGDRVEGPALITEDQTTTVVTSAWAAAIDPRGHILLERRS